MYTVDYFDDYILLFSTLKNSFTVRVFCCHKQNDRKTTPNYVSTSCRKKIYVGTYYLHVLLHFI